MTAPRYDVWLRDINNRRIERLDAWTSLTAILRFNGVGTWNLEVPTSSILSNYITKTGGIIITRDGETIFSGSVSTDYERTTESVKVSGEDDNAILRTPARPTPSLTHGPYPDEYDVTTGVASTIMISLVNRNIGPAA